MKQFLLEKSYIRPFLKCIGSCIAITIQISVRGGGGSVVPGSKKHTTIV